MAEGIAAGLAQTVLTQLASLALQEIGSAQGVKNEVRRLRNTLTAIKDVLPHAENLQLSNNDLKSWLRRIKDAAYHAEDVLDDFATEALHTKLAMQSIGKRVRHFASSSNPIVQRFKMAHRIKEVRENLKDIFDDHQSFGLQKGFKENCGFISEGRQTHSFIPEGRVVGRDAEKEKMVKLLLDSSGRDGLSVIPIQGMGGIGKTALAQFVYNDERVIDSFKENRMWVCVSDEFDLQKITEKIIRSGTDKECPNLDLDQLQSRIRQHLQGKRYLLVLDDIWNEELDKWEELRDLLIGGAGGSTIIVTTRSERVGKLMGTTAVHQLSKLSEGDCWNLFKGRAFNEANDDIDPELVEIGRDIVKKCVGVPLAAKTLGGLCYQAKKQTWEFVRDSDVWRLPEEKNGILRALRISYDHLPFYLKQCFAYCSIFPKDYEIEKDMLIELWIAQGFIPSSGENRLPEDIGNEYIEVLMWISFFQEPIKDACYDNLISFRMHDLVHDLAHLVAGVECFSICKVNEESFPIGVRHLFFNISSPFKTPGIIPKPSDIRTLMFQSRIDFSMVSTIFSSLKFLRVLKFRNDFIDHLPNSFDELKHLRHLQIQGGKIRKLPKSVTNLQNLQVLKLKCKRLESLPKEINNMISLRHIDFQNRYFDHQYGFYMMGRVDIFISHMPWGLEELKLLQALSHFVVGKDKGGCDLNGLNELTNLGGSLDIRNLQNVETAMESKETNLKKKTNLQQLRLEWKESSDDHVTREAVGFEVLENLEPPLSLKGLQIDGYVGTRFPRWMMEAHLTLMNVVLIELKNCGKCERLPCFSHLPSLKILIIKGMDGLQCIEGRPKQIQKEWFPSLTKLFINTCPNMESWFPMEAQPQQEQQQMLSLSVSFPSLVLLHIHDCPKLKNIPLVPSIIKHLVLIRSNGELLQSLIPSPNSCLASLEELCIEKCEGLESWPNWLGPQLTSLPELHIGCTPSLPFLPQQIQHLPVLESLGLYDYCEEALPEWMANITSLQVLSINCCPNLQILPEWVLTVNTTIKFLWITECPHLMRRYNSETGEDRHKIAHIESAIYNI